MAEDPENQTLVLKDGRNLGYAEYGDPNGEPVFYFHGLTTSRLDGGFNEDDIAKRGVRFVAIDRPGMGLSDFQQGREIDSWPEQVVQLADHLGIEKFAVVGVSAGGPHVAVCAARIPERLTAAAIVSGAGPYGVSEARPKANFFQRVAGRIFAAFAQFPIFTRPWFWLMVQGVKRSKPGDVRKSSLYKRLPPADQAIVARPEVQEASKKTMLESFRQGTLGNAYELGMHMRPWRFRLDEIKMKVHLWHGDADTIVPVEAGRYMASAIADCHSRIIPGQGHFMVIDYMGEVIDALLAETAVRQKSAATA
jgi:pimeloyl-ACP methyl ester carboxylesterase